MNWPTTIPLTVKQYETLVERGDFDAFSGQVELIRGRIVHMNPQGPQHSDPVDFLTEWSIEQTNRRFTIRTEKPIVIPNANSCPEPDIAWVTRRRYLDRHPLPNEVQLLIEISYSSIDFDRTEKLSLYAESGIQEYWQVDVPSRSVVVYREPAESSYQSVSVFALGASVSPNCLPEARLDVSSLFPQ
jgi:Uma2 family endonuclease